MRPGVIEGPPRGADGGRPAVRLSRPLARPDDPVHLRRGLARAPCGEGSVHLELFAEIPASWRKQSSRRSGKRCTASAGSSSARWKRRGWQKRIGSSLEAKRRAIPLRSRPLHGAGRRGHGRGRDHQPGLRLAAVWRGAGEAFRLPDEKDAAVVTSRPPAGNAPARGSIRGGRLRPRLSRRHAARCGRAEGIRRRSAAGRRQ